MARKVYIPEQVIRILRETEVLMAEGMTAVEATDRIRRTFLFHQRLSIPMAVFPPVRKPLSGHPDATGL